MLRSVAAACLAFIVFLITHVTYFYWVNPDEKAHTLLFMAGMGVIFYVLLLFILPSDDWFQRKCHLSPEALRRVVYPILGVLFYGFLFLGYLEFYFTAERSITFRMLMITYKQPDQAITKDAMFDRYNVPGIIDKRFDDLVYGGYLKTDGMRYRLTSKGTFILHIYKTAIDVLHLGTGEKKLSERAWASLDKRYLTDNTHETSRV